MIWGMGTWVTRAETPRLRTLIRLPGGVTLTDGHAHLPGVRPSRAGLLTGRYQQSFGFWDNIGPFRVSREVEPGIPLEVPILSERLKPLGYACGLFENPRGRCRGDDALQPLG